MWITFTLVITNTLHHLTCENHTDYRCKVCRVPTMKTMNHRGTPTISCLWSMYNFVCIREIIPARGFGLVWSVSCYSFLPKTLTRNPNTTILNYLSYWIWLLFYRNSFFGHIVSIIEPSSASSRFGTDTSTELPIPYSNVQVCMYCLDRKVKHSTGTVCLGFSGKRETTMVINVSV